MTTQPVADAGAVSRARSAICCAAGRRSTALIAAGQAVTLAARADVARGAAGRRAVARARSSAARSSTSSPPARSRRPRAACFAGFDRIDSWTGDGQPAFADRLAAAAGAARVCPPVSRHANGRARHGVLRPLPRRRRAVPSPAGARRGRCLGRNALGPRTTSATACSSSTRQRQHGARTGRAWPRWPRAWRAAADRGRRSLGPAEIERGTTIPADAVVAGEPLERVAALLRRAASLSRQRFRHQPSRRAWSARTAWWCSATPIPRVWAPLGRPRPRAARGHNLRACGPGRFCTHRLPVADGAGRARRVAPPPVAMTRTGA